MNIQTVIFDMDGTLLDTLAGLRDSANRAMAPFGYPPRTIEEIRTFVGNGMGKLLERCLPEGVGEERFAACFAAFRADYAESMYDGTTPYEGIVPLLDALQSRGYRMAVVSNKLDGAVKELNAHYFGDRIPVAVGERPGNRRKPAPDGVFAALEELSMPRVSAVYVGDSEVDLATADAAGLPCLAAVWGFRGEAFLRSHGAKRLCPAPADVLAALERLDREG